MIYMIVRWTGLENGYEILHYSHQFEDAYKQYERLLTLYEKISLLVDVRAIDFYQNSMIIKNLKDSIIKANAATKEKNATIQSA